MFYAQTIEQFKIMRWLEESFAPGAIRQVDLLTRNSVRIVDRNFDTALVICRQDGMIELMDDVEAC